MNIPSRSGPRIRITKPTGLISAAETERKSLIYTCPYCSIKFVQNSQFFRHMSTNHQVQQSQETYQCNECKVVFNKKSILDLHCKVSHQLKPKSKCGSCSITFKSRHCLRRHLKLKQLMREHSCIKCPKQFTNRLDLVKHITNKHASKSVNYQCSLCLLKFKVKESLLMHFRRVHSKL